MSEAARLYEMSSKKNRNLLLFYLVAIVYILIIVASTTDLDLLLPESSITLPVLSVDIALLFFYVFSSPLVLILHFNLLHNTIEHQKKIQQWEKQESINILHSTIEYFAAVAFAMMTGGSINLLRSTMEYQKKIKQWKKEKFISSHLMHPYIFDFAYLSPPGRWGNILICLTSFLLYFLAPICLFCIQWWFSDYQSFWYSSWHFICLWADLYLLVLFFNQTHSSSRKKQDSSGSKGMEGLLSFFKSSGKLRKKYDKKFLMIILIFFISFFYFGIVGMLQFERTITWLEKLHEFTPRITISPGTRIQKQSLEKHKFIEIQVGTNETNAWENHGGNYDLSGRRLVFSDLSGNYMQKIVLKGAHLQGSDMRMVQLQGADMRSAQLRGADMWRAQLQGADMRGAQLQGADMRDAQLQGADMQEVQLQGAYMRRVQLQGASMQMAQLQGADMLAAQLQGAYMHGAQLQGADIRSAQLQGADMQRIQLQGAYMRRAQLQGANIREAKFSGTDMQKANLRGSFCKGKRYYGFFDRINARIGKRGLKGCNMMDNSQFGALDEDTADSIIENLRSNGNVSEGITDEVEKNINNRIGEAASIIKIKKGVLKLKEVCKPIAGWSENLEYTPGLKKVFADWLNTKAGKKSRLKKCSMPIIRSDQLINLPKKLTM